MDNPYGIVKSLIRTEKGTDEEILGKYLFWVEKTANKIQIAHAVEGIYKVKVEKVNTLMIRGKQKRVRYKYGKTPDWKKAVVTLEKGQKIDMK